VRSDYDWGACEPPLCDVEALENGSSAWKFPKANRDVRSPATGAVELLDRFAARREEAGGLSEVDVRDEQALFPVGLVAEQSPVGPHHR